MALTDTDAATLGRMDELYRRMTPAEKLHRVRALTLMVDRLALTGLRSRHPDEPEGRLMMRLARIRLGADLFERAYPGGLGSDDS
jgi:hypothetical protein